MRPLIALAALAAATPAAADIHPRYHEAARAAAANVVVIEVSRVQTPRTPMGDCAIDGRISAVERGARFTVGQTLAVTVPCYREDATLPSSGIQWQSVEALRPSRRGRVWLDAEGRQLGSRYYQILEALPR